MSLASASRVDIVRTAAVLTCGPITLAPLQPEHRQGLLAIALDPEIWSRSTTRLLTPAQLDSYVDEAVALAAQGARRTFVISHRDRGIVGATALANHSPADGRVEIGWSWLGLAHHGSGANTLAKGALLQFCFGPGGLERVEWKTDVLNGRARAALLKIGATEEGVLRSHTLMPDGRRRDTIYYSVLRGEWPRVRAAELASCPELVWRATA